MDPYPAFHTYFQTEDPSNSLLRIPRQTHLPCGSPFLNSNLTAGYTSKIKVPRANVREVSGAHSQTVKNAVATGNSPSLMCNALFSSISRPKVTLLYMHSIFPFFTHTAMVLGEDFVC